MTWAKDPWRSKGTLGHQFPDAPRKLILGIPHVQVPCKRCKGLVWMAAMNTQAFCNDCVPSYVWDSTENQQPAKRSNPIERED